MFPNSLRLVSLKSWTDNFLSFVLPVATSRPAPANILWEANCIWLFVALHTMTLNAGLTLFLPLPHHFLAQFSVVSDGLRRHQVDSSNRPGPSFIIRLSLNWQIFAATSLSVQHIPVTLPGNKESCDEGIDIFLPLMKHRSQGEIRTGEKHQFILEFL